MRRKYVLSKDTLMILLHLCQYSYICVNEEYILYILYFCLIVRYILLSQSIIPHDKSYVFLSLGCNSVNIAITGVNLANPISSQMFRIFFYLY